MYQIRNCNFYVVVARYLRLVDIFFIKKICYILYLTCIDNVRNLNYKLVLTCISLISGEGFDFCRTSVR